MDIRVSDWAKLGSVIRDARKARGLSQHDLAGHAGVSRSWLARLEAGHRGAALEPLFRLLDALGMNLALHDPSRSEEAAAASQTVSGPSAQSPSALSVIAKQRASAAMRRRGWQDAADNFGRGIDPDSGRDDMPDTESTGTDDVTTGTDDVTTRGHA